MSNIKFRIAAKTDVGRVRSNNEDNLQAACDLTTAPMKWVNDQECDLGDKGALLIVADGMGGMNAGEVASEIAINTIREFFSPENITNQVISSKVEIDAFMKKSIKEADNKIKQAARENSANRGMGTTIVIGWILDDRLYVAWCGDSRAYIYNRKTGLRQLSKDHSYVQTLVDKGTISKEDAFDYPDSNIITRCLSDSDQKARPDTLSSPVTLCTDDIVLLCTDGLSGMIRDHEIEMVLTENDNNMSDCADKLIEAACEAAGQDNITVALCKIVSGGESATRASKKNGLSNTVSFKPSKTIHINFKKYLSALFKLLLVLAIFVAGYFCGQHNIGSHFGFMAYDSVQADTTTMGVPQEVKTPEEATTEPNEDVVGSGQELRNKVNEAVKVISNTNDNATTSAAANDFTSANTAESTVNETDKKQKDATEDSSSSADSLKIK